MGGLSQQPFLCLMGGGLSAALWVWCSGLRDVSGHQQSPKRQIQMCKVLKHSSDLWDFASDSRVGLTAFAPHSFCFLSISHYILPLTRVRSEYLLFGMQVYLLPAAQLLRRSWHRELLYFLAQEVAQDCPSVSLQNSGKRNSFLPGVQSLTPGLVAAVSVPSTSVTAWAPWGQEALSGFPAS